jgi:mannonate dehydratase
MKLALSYFGGVDQRKAEISKQLGVRYAVTSAYPMIDGLPYYDLRSLNALKKAYDDCGLELSVIEGSDMLDRAKLGLPGGDEEIEGYIKLLRNLPSVGIDTVCYNWMPIVGWQRTEKRRPSRGGALVTAFDWDDVKDAPPTEYGVIPQETLWRTLEHFLKAVVPVAEEAGVKLALHPDDPPVPELFGIGRILTSADAFQRVIDLVPSPCNGITFCQGCFATMGEDIPLAIRRFGKKIFFVHFRDIRGDRWRFEETFHDDGITDMGQAMRCNYEIGFDGPIRPDHVPTMAGEDNNSPSYGLLGNLYAVGYMKGLMASEGGRSFIEVSDPK